MRIIFMGYHNIGHACLEVLIDLCRHFGDEIAAVVTHADDPRENHWFASVGTWPSRIICRSTSPRTPTPRSSSRSCGIWRRIFSFPAIIATC